MKQIYLKIITIFFGCFLFINTSYSNKNIRVLKNGNIEVIVSAKSFIIKYSMKADDIVISDNNTSAISLNGNRVVSIRKYKDYVYGNDKNKFKVYTESGDSALVDFEFNKNVLALKVLPFKDSKNSIEVNLGGANYAYGLGDSGGWNKTFNLINEKETKYIMHNDGGGKRWLSSFVIFPRKRVAGVMLSDGDKSVTLSKDRYSMNITKKGGAVFYYIFGDNNTIYKSYKQLREKYGYADVKPKSRLFELGWESWDALGWNTNQVTVKNILEKFLKNDFKIRWAVTGSGFWEKGGTTTSFGKFNNKFSDPVSFRNWMYENDVRWMIGLRTNFIPEGGPYYPKTKKRDKNLKVRSFKGYPLTTEGLEFGYMLSDDRGIVSKTSTVFPIVPCYLLDGRKNGAALWYQKQYSKWGVDGIKEDTMMDLDGETSLFNAPMKAIADSGGLVMARCGNISAPGTLLRINDTGVRDMKRRLPINYMQYAVCGAPNVYSDVAGVHNMRNLKAVDANIRHTWLLSLTAGLAVGAYPDKWEESKLSAFKKAIDFHYEIGTYLYSAAMRSYKTGYPFTLTPMEIAYSDDKHAYELKNFQWMIGESVIATPLVKEINKGKLDIYLPKGVWYDFDSGKRYKGGKIYKGVKMPLDKTPCFVGGKGIIILRNDEKLKVRVYKTGFEGSEVFYDMKTDKSINISVRNNKIDKGTSVKSGSVNILSEWSKPYLEFEVKPGERYVVE